MPVPRRRGDERAGRSIAADGRRSGRGDRHAGAGDRPRRDGAQPGGDGRLRPGAQRAPAAAREDAQVRGDRPAADGGRRGRRLRAEDERGRGAGRRRRRRHLHLERGGRPGQAGPRRRAGAGACGWRSPSIRSRASSGWRPRCARPARRIDVFVEIDVGQGRCGAPGRGRRRARPPCRLACAARGRPALRRPAGLPRRGAASARRRRARGGVAPRGGAGARRARRHHRGRHRLPARHRRRHRHLRLRRRQRRLGRAAGGQLPVHGPRLRRQRSRRRTRRASSTRCSSRAR